MPEKKTGITSKRNNNFSFLRIIFAISVILSHSFDLIDGNSSRQLLVRIFGTVTFGSLAVDGFFIVSGYLIIQSYLASRPTDYLIKRLLRIYPGFITAFIVSTILCQFFSGHSLWLPAKIFFHNCIRLLFLQSPGLVDPYPGSYFANANGSMWTISYEFRCYLAVMLLGALGCLRRPRILLAITFVALLVYLLFPENAWPQVVQNPADSMSTKAWILERLRDMALGAPAENIRLFGMFLAGGCFFCFRDVIVYRRIYACLSIFLLVGCLFFEHLAEPAFAIFGGYLIFWLALHLKPLPFSNYLNNIDLSYGIYLYAFPVQKVLISQFPQIQPYELFIITLPVSCIAAYFSWAFLEKPCLGFKARLSNRGQIILNLRSSRNRGTPLA